MTPEQIYLVTLMLTVDTGEPGSELAHCLHRVAVSIDENVVPEDALYHAEPDMDAFWRSVLPEHLDGCLILKVEEGQVDEIVIVPPRHPS